MLEEIRKRKTHLSYMLMSEFPRKKSYNIMLLSNFTDGMMRAAIHDKIIYLEWAIEITRGRLLRLAVTQNQYDAENLTEEEARDILSGRLNHADPGTQFDDSNLLITKEMLE